MLISRKYHLAFIVFMLVSTLFAFQFLLVGHAIAEVVSSDSDLLNWRYDPYPLTNLYTQDGFGTVVYDPTASVYRLFYQSAANATTGLIYQVTSTNGRVFGNATLALGVGAVGAYDAKSTGVPFVWYEAGQTRPWRMIYMGRKADDSVYIMLATSVDGTTWERKDTAGNALTDPIIPRGAGAAWDNNNMDTGSLIKVGATYYLYYDTTTTGARQTGLATSTDLVTWTKHADNPLFTGVTDYADVTQEGTPDATAGFFCPDIVYWPKADGTARYVMIMPHFAAGGATASLDLYVSASPIFTRLNRTYIGKVFDPTGGALSLQDVITKADTPHIITDDITRNVVASSRTGNDVLMPFSLYDTTNGWTHAYLVHHKTLHGSVLTNVSADFPVTAPAHKLAPTVVDATTKGLWLPGSTGTLRDLTGAGYHLGGGYTQIDSSGILFTAASSQAVRWKKTGATVTPLNAITGDFTLEARVTFASDFTSSYRGVIGYSNGNSTTHHFYMYVGGAAGPAYTLYFTTSSGGASKTASVSLGPIVNGTQYRLAITKTGGKIYFFKDGVLLNAGGSAYDWTIDDTAATSLYVGSGGGGNNSYWDGYIDEIRISDTARWTANYTPAALTYAYQPSGSIFSPVYNLGSANSPIAVNPTVTTPSGTVVSQNVRSTSSASDQSSSLGDFLTLPQSSITSQYQQFALNLTTNDTTQSPSVSSVNVQNVAVSASTEVAVESSAPLSGHRRDVSNLLASNVLNTTPVKPLSSTPTLFTRSLKPRMSGGDVKALQQTLNAQGFILANAGPGSPGNETDYFGLLTENAVRKFQCKYSIVCSGTSQTTGYGNFGPKTRAKILEVFGR